MSTFLKKRQFDGENVTQRLFFVLTYGGYSTFEDLNGLSNSHLMRIPNCGRVTLKEAKDIMKKRNIPFNVRPKRSRCSKCGQILLTGGRQMTSEEVMDAAMHKYAGAMQRLA